MTIRCTICAWLLTLLLSFAVPPASAAPWLPFGPDGGDARRLVLDPHDHTHLYLGTTNGWIYESHNGGANWRRLARVGKRDDLVLDSIVVDPSDSRHLLVGAWVVGNSDDGGLYLSSDAGATWTSQAEMRGQSIRALAISDLDPRILVAGSLRGVFRSTDGGQRWTLISPADSHEIHEIESVAIDPKDPGVIYAGTWHLPWKTTDAGEHWDNIKTGIIDDSDVFSIIVDPVNNATVYASACSGIYKSENAGLLFRKVQGIPATARRTRVLLQDPHHLDTVFAGTTEGLFRSDDAGKTWSRTTGPEVIVNDVSIDAADSRRVLIATDRGGVLASNDGGDSFHSSNNGFSARQITALRRDANHPATVYVGIVNDKEWGGVFQSDNGGINWVQRSDGLQGRDVFALGQAHDGTILAGTSHGLFRLDGETQSWLRIDEVPSEVASPSDAVNSEAPHAISPAAVVTRPPVPIGRNQFRHPQRKAETRLHPVRTSSKKSGATRPRKLASSTRAKGVKSRPTLRSTRSTSVRSGKAGSKKLVHTVLRHQAAIPPPGPVVVNSSSLAPTPHSFDGAVNAIITVGENLLASTTQGLLLSKDDGKTWLPSPQENSSDWRYLASARQNVVAASLHSVFFSSDAGASWVSIKLPDVLTLVNAVTVDPAGEVWVGGREGVFVSSDAGASWHTPKNLFVNSVNSLFYDEASERIMVTTGSYSSIIFTVQLPSKQVTYTDSGWNLRFARPIGDHLIAITLFDGVVIEPRMVASPASSSPRAAAPAAQPPVAGTVQE